MKPSAADLRKMVAAFDWAAWDKELEPDFAKVYTDLVEDKATDTTAAYGADGVSFDAEDPFVSKHLTTYIGERITQLSGTTKSDVSNAIVRALDNADAGLSTSDLRDLVLETVREKYEGYESWRALRIARTESAIGYNTGTVLGGIQADFEEFDVTDGTDDEECAEANGSVWTADECLEDPVAHPNCVRVFTPHASASAEDGEEDVAAGAGLSPPVDERGYPKLSQRWIDYLRKKPESGPGYQFVDVVFADGRHLSNAVVINAEILWLPDAFNDAEVMDLTMHEKR